MAYAMIILFKHQSKTKEDSSVLEERRKHSRIVEGGGESGEQSSIPFTGSYRNEITEFFPR